MPKLHAMDSRIILHELLARNTNITILREWRLFLTF